MAEAPLVTVESALPDRRQNSKKRFAWAPAIADIARLNPGIMSSSTFSSEHALKLKVYLPFPGRNHERFVRNTPMKYAAIAIIGGGLTNSTAASMLGRAGIRAVLIDPHPVYPSDFRVKNSAAMTARTFLARSNRRIGAVVDGSR